jgi:phage repressor protein C with HTH and peptisase S24 domain
MPLKHNDVWKAIDLLAEKQGTSPSGLARKAGLSPTIFNPSKRISEKRKRWPSTESIAKILQVTGTGMDEFLALAMPRTAARSSLPLIGYGEAGREGYFDDAGFPAGSGWEEVKLPSFGDPHAFALEVSGKSMEPVYREGDRIVVSPAAEIRRGDRVVVRTVKGEVLVKQLGRESAQKLDLISLNPEFPAVSIGRRDIEWIYRIIWASQ